MMADIKRKVPNLRFKGFTDYWEQHKLGDIAKVTKLAGFEFTKYINYSSKGKILAIRGLNIKDGKFNLQDVKYIDNSDFNKLTRSKLRQDDILFTYVGTIGNSAIVPAGVKWYLAPNVCLIRTQTENAKFISHLIQSDKFQHQEIPKWITTSSQPALSMENIRKFSIILPTISEQLKISNLVSIIDTIITLQQRKLELLKQLKKGLLQKMFADKGSKRPILRFSGFTEDWKQCKLGKLARIDTGKLNANAMVMDGKYDFYTSGKEKYKIDKYAFVGPAITVAGNGATVGYMHYADNKFNAYQRTYVLTNLKGDRRFLFNTIQANLPHKIYQESRTGNIPYIVLDMLTDLSIMIPLKEEQASIGNFVNVMDNFITAQENRLNSSKLTKKFLLQKLFI